MLPAIPAIDSLSTAELAIFRTIHHSIIGSDVAPGCASPNSQNHRRALTQYFTYLSDVAGTSGSDDMHQGSRMLSRYFLETVAALVLLSACPASAYVSPPVLVPSSPLAGEVLAIDVTAGSCDLFLGSPTPIPVTRNGADLRVVLPSRHETNTTFCNYGTGTGRYITTSFPAGNYTLQIDRSYPTLFGTVTEPFATVPLIVRGVAQESPIPATGPLALLILAAGLALIAARRRHLSRSHPPGASHTGARMKRAENAPAPRVNRN